jgi:hypothetical protein
MGFFDFLKRGKENNYGKELARIVLSNCEDKVIDKFIVPPPGKKTFERFKLRPLQNG